MSHDIVIGVQHHVAVGRARGKASFIIYYMTLPGHSLVVSIIILFGVLLFKKSYYLLLCEFNIKYGSFCNYYKKA